MQDQFFQQGEYHQSQQPEITTTEQPTHPTEQNHWQQAEFQSTPVQQSLQFSMDNQEGYSSNIMPNLGSSGAIEVDDQVTHKILEQQNRINDVLRQKSSKEYEDKQARKAAGREQLEGFFAQKEKELEDRKQLNVENERKLVDRTKELTTHAGWEKVFQNVNLKQGEYKGTKNVNRMRQSILGKYEDDKNRQ